MKLRNVKHQNYHLLFLFQDEKAVKLNALNARIEEVIAHKESLICERKDLMHNKMAKAEAKRQEYLNFIYLSLSFILLLCIIYCLFLISI